MAASSQRTSLGRRAARTGACRGCETKAMPAWATAEQALGTARASVAPASAVVYSMPETVHRVARWRPSFGLTVGRVRSAGTLRSQTRTPGSSRRPVFALVPAAATHDRRTSCHRSLQRLRLAMVASTGVLAKHRRRGSQTRRPKTSLYPEGPNSLVLCENVTGSTR